MRHLDFCDEMNRSHFARETGCWYWVQRDKATGETSVQKLEGLLGDEVHRYASGWRPDFSGWEPEDLAKYEIKLRRLFNLGRNLDQQEPML